MNLIDKVDFTIIGNFNPTEILDNVARGQDAGYTSFCFSEQVALFASHINARKLAITANFPIPHNDMRLSTMEEYLMRRKGYGIDVVLPRMHIKAKQYDVIIRRLTEISHILSKDADMKVIIETGHFDDNEILAVTKVLVDSGIPDYIKTCTGYGPRGVSVHDIVLIKQCTDNIKASGGIKTLEQILDLEKSGASVFGIGYKSALALAHELKIGGHNGEEASEERNKNT